MEAIMAKIPEKMGSGMETIADTIVAARKRIRYVQKMGRNVNKQIYSTVRHARKRLIMGFRGKKIRRQAYKQLLQRVDDSDTDEEKLTLIRSAKALPEFKNRPRYLTNLFRLEEPLVMGKREYYVEDESMPLEETG